jgi:acetyl/propionyl-CoA carboxylase alpha subunit
MKYITYITKHQYNIEILDEKSIKLGDKTYEYDFDSINDQSVFSLLLDGLSYEANIYPGDDGWQVLLYGHLYPVIVIDEREKRLRESVSSKPQESGEFHLKAPMPGLIVSVPVIENQTVSKGDVLMVLESMKMQNELRSPRDGVVYRLKVKVGDSVEHKQTMLSIL